MEWKGVVIALNRNGFMEPVTALTKVLPTLVNGIQIVGFISPLFENGSETE